MPDNSLLALLGLPLLALNCVLLAYADYGGRRLIRRFMDEVEGPPLFATHLAAEAAQAYRRGLGARIGWVRRMRKGLGDSMRPAARRVLGAWFCVKLTLAVLLAFCGATLYSLHAATP
jgi:hypothetical protein